MGVAWNLFSGYSGLMSFGHAAFFGIGAYTVALLLVHLHQPYAKSFEALQMLAVALTLLCTGPGPLSVDGWRARRELRAGADGHAVPAGA